MSKLPYKSADRVDVLEPGLDIGHLLNQAEDPPKPVPAGQHSHSTGTAQARHRHHSAVTAQSQTSPNPYLAQHGWGLVG